jgi:hypothetical protein
MKYREYFIKKYKKNYKVETLREMFIHNFKVATMLFMMMGFADAVVSLSVFKYARPFFFEHEGGLLARVSIATYLNGDTTLFYLTIIGHLVIYFGIIIFGIYLIDAFKKESDEKIAKFTWKQKYPFICLLIVIYGAGFMHYYGALSWLVN